MTKPDLTHAELDQLFETARHSAPEPDPAFLARLDADAAAFAKRSAPVSPVQGATGLWDQVRGALGGWGGMGGLVAATVAGVWIGIAPPDMLPDPISLVQGTYGETDTLDSFFSLADDTLIALEEG